MTKQSAYVVVNNGRASIGEVRALYATRRGGSTFEITVEFANGTRERLMIGTAGKLDTIGFEIMNDDRVRGFVAGTGIKMRGRR